MKVSKVVVLIPFKLRNPKSRLSKLLTLEERRKFATFMLSDVVESIRSCGVREIRIAVPDRESHKACEEATGCREILLDERKLDDLVNYHIKMLSSDETLAIIMADLPLLRQDVLERFFSSEGDVVISPGRRGGTNMLLVRDREFEVSYHYGSFMKHLEIAKSRGLTYSIFDSFYSSIDIDDESDVLELLIHGEGKKSRDYLLSIGYGISCKEKEPKIVRDIH
jgi:2-phospho-L-lactate guanylyltransferase